MKSKTLNTLILVLIFLFLTTPVSAQGPSVSTQNPIRQQVQDKRLEIQENRASATADRKSALTKLKLQVAQKIQARLQTRLRSRFEQLEKTQLRLEEKLALRKNQGQDVSLVESHLTEIISIKSTYQTNINNFIEVSNQMMASDKPAQFSSQLRQSARLVNGDLNLYRQTLKRVIQTLINLPKVD